MIEFLQGLGLDPKSILEIAFKIIEKRKNELTGTFTSCILVSIKEAFKEEYFGYKIKYPNSAKDFEYLIEEVEKILIEFQIKDSRDAYLKSDSIVAQLKEKRLITVVDEDGNENKYDVNKFYNLLNLNIRKHIGNNTVSNTELINRLIFDGAMEKKELFSLVKDIKEKLDNLENRIANDNPSALNVKVTTRELQDCDRKGMDLILDLSPHFNENQSYKEGSNWEIVKDKIDSFIKTLDKDVNYVLHLKSNYSIAYYLGTKLKTKYDYSIKLYQPTDGKKNIWRGDSKKEIFDYEKFKVNPIKLTGKSTAIIISVTLDIKNDVKNALESMGEDITNIIEFKLESNRILDGVHANKLANQVKAYLKKCSLLGTDNELHIFISSPISFPFILGDMSFDFNNVNLYEYVCNGEVIYEKAASI